MFLVFICICQIPINLVNLQMQVEEGRVSHLKQRLARCVICKKLKMEHFRKISKWNHQRKVQWSKNQQERGQDENWIKSPLIKMWRKEFFEEKKTLDPACFLFKKWRRKRGWRLNQAVDQWDINWKKWKALIGMEVKQVKKGWKDGGESWSDSSPHPPHQVLH